MFSLISKRYNTLKISQQQFAQFCQIFGSVNLRAFLPRGFSPLPRPADIHPRPASLEKTQPRPSLIFIFIYLHQRARQIKKQILQLNMSYVGAHPRLETC